MPSFAHLTSASPANLSHQRPPLQPKNKRQLLQAPKRPPRRQPTTKRTRRMATRKLLLNTRARTMRTRRSLRRRQRTSRPMRPQLPRAGPLLLPKLSTRTRSRRRMTWQRSRGMMIERLCSRLNTSCLAWIHTKMLRNLLKDTCTLRI